MFVKTVIKTVTSFDFTGLVIFSRDFTLDIVISSLDCYQTFVISSVVFVLFRSALRCGVRVMISNKLWLGSELALWRSSCML